VAVSDLKRFIGAGEIYTDCTKPAANTNIALTAGVPAGGTSVGLTSGPATLEYKPEFKGVEIEQTYGEVAPRVTKESVTLKFKCAEATYAKIALALQTGTQRAASTPTGTFYTVGGKDFFDTQCITLVSPFDNGSGTTWYEWVCLYDALSVDGLKLEYKHGETRMIEVTLTGYSDPTRPVGDQLFQIGQQTA
jgi:hypothetical protein